MPSRTENISADSWQEVVLRKVAAIRFGSVQITVHEGRVTQVEAVEKTRILPDKTESARGPKPQ